MPKSLDPINQETLEAAIQGAQSLSTVVARLGWKGGSAYARVKKYAAEFGVELPISKNNEHLIGTRSSNRTPNSLVFIENSAYSNNIGLKDRLRDLSIEFICSECSVGETWMGKHLCLQVDHVNGVRNDNRLSNLRLLCPNCHSQTSTYGGRNIATKLPSDEELIALVKQHGVAQTARLLGVGASSVSHRKTKIFKEKPHLDYRN